MAPLSKITRAEDMKHDIQLLQRLRYAFSSTFVNASSIQHEESPILINADIERLVPNSLPLINAKTQSTSVVMVSGAGIFVILSILAAPRWKVALAILIVVGSILLAFIVIRHRQILAGHLSPSACNYVAKLKGQGPDLSSLEAVSILYVVGSGGHTSEMMTIIRKTLKVTANVHRRYIISEGDNNSRNLIRSLETQIHQSCIGKSPGTFDVLAATRARKVHQSYLSSVFTSLQCALEIIMALTTIPESRRGSKHLQAFRNPNLIVTNGPGTGFIVALVAHILKILYLAPHNKMQIVFIETWARTHNMGLTGRLFDWTGIADLFVVQNDMLSSITGRPSIGNINLNAPKTPGQPKATGLEQHRMKREVVVVGKGLRRSVGSDV